MSHEHRIGLALAPDALVDLGRWLEERGGFVHARTSDPAHLALRLAASEQRDRWPDDLELRVAGNETLLTVHALDRDGRRRVVQLADAFLAARGIEARFEEL